MQVQLNSFVIQGCCNQAIASYSIPSSCQDIILQCTHLSCQQIIFPNTLYNIQTQFTVSVTDINGTFNCVFYVGNITFQQIISRLQQAFKNNGYSIIEYLSDVKQSSGKIQISSSIDFTISVPAQYQNMFGNITQQTTKLYISANICDLTINQLVLIHCNAIAPLFNQNGFNDVIYSFQLNTLQQYSYLTQYVDTLQNGKKYNQAQEITIWFTDASNNTLSFQNASPFYITMTMYHLKQKYIDKQTKFLQGIYEYMRFFVEQKMKKEISNLEQQFNEKYKQEQQDELQQDKKQQ